MVSFVDPRAQVGLTLEDYELSIDLTQANAPKIAFLANGFPDSVAFLAAVRDALSALLPAMQARDFDKGNASITVTDAMLEDIKGVDAAVAAYGH